MKEISGYIAVAGTFIYFIFASLLITGCGSSSSKTYEREYIPEPATPIPTNTFIVTAAEDSSSEMSYTTVGDSSILIDCGVGGCGDINVYVATEVPQVPEV